MTHVYTTSTNGAPRQQATNRKIKNKIPKILANITPYCSPKSRQKQPFKKQNTDITRHLTDNLNHAVCFNNPIIQARSDHRRKLLIKETLMIQQEIQI